MADADRARELFPGSDYLQRRWLDARRYLAGRRPSVDIGAPDTARFARTLREANIHPGDICGPAVGWVEWLFGRPE